MERIFKIKFDLSRQRTIPKENKILEWIIFVFMKLFRALISFELWLQSMVRSCSTQHWNGEDVTQHSQSCSDVHHLLILKISYIKLPDEFYIYIWASILKIICITQHLHGPGWSGNYPFYNSPF
jgi:hypothetical protein